MEEIYSYIRNTGYFMIFSAVVRLLTPEDSFRAYINLFLGLMFMVVMLNPISRFVKTELPKLQDYVLKNGAAAGQELFGGGEENRDIVTEEYKKALEERIEELCKAYVEEGSVSVQTDGSFNVTEVYIEGEIIKDTGGLKRIVSQLCGLEKEYVIITGEWEE